MPKMTKNMHRGGEEHTHWRLFAIYGAIDYWKIRGKKKKKRLFWQKNGFFSKTKTGIGTLWRSQNDKQV
jgi:hypothetical protein